MRRAALSIFAMILTLQGASAQDLTLGKAIAIAQDSTIQAFRSQYALQRSRWEYEKYAAGRRPRLSFALAPWYRKYTAEPYLNYFYLRDYNMIGTYAEMRLDQQANAIGGDWFVSTGALWNRYLGPERGTGMFSSVPLSAGYTNDLIGYNSHKWEKELSQSELESRRKAHEHELSIIALQTASLYTDCIVAGSRYDICLANKEVAAKMLSIGREKYEIASISKNELFALDLQYVNASNNLSEALLEVENARAALLSYLQLDTDGQDGKMDFEMPSLPEIKTVDPQQAVNMAMANNPEVSERRTAVISARQEADKASVMGRFLQSSVDVSLGLQSYASHLSGLYGDISPFIIGGVSIKVPIFDGGLARSREKAAQYALKTAEASEDDVRRELEHEVREAVRNFNNAQDLLQSTRDAVRYADEAFALAEELYGNGEIDINTFVLAQNRKDDAWTNYLNAFRKYWTSYYTICALCVHQF